MDTLVMLNNITSSHNINNQSASNNKSKSIDTFSDALSKSMKKADEFKAQERLELDMKRIASFIGIGPKTLAATIGKLNIDPENYNFKLESNADYSLNDIAQYFGISPMTMQAILDKLGISKSDLVEKKMEGKIIMKLKEFFRLSLEQENELRNILQQYQKDEPEENPSTNR